MKEGQDKKKAPSGKKKTILIAVFVGLAVLLALAIGLILGLVLKNELGYDQSSPFDQSEFINKIFPNGLWDLVINLSAFVILLVIVFIVGYKPVVKAMKARGDAIEAQVREAKENLEIAKQASENKDALIEEGKQEASKIIEKAKKQAEEQADRIVLEAKEDASKIRQKADEDIAIAKEKSKQEVKKEIVDVAIEASTVLLGREVDKEDNRRLVDDFVSSLEEGGRKR